MDMEFRKLTLDDSQKFCELLSQQDNLGWENQFGMIYAWDVFDETKICIEKDVIYVYNIFYGKTVFFPPFVRKPEFFSAAVDKAAEYCKQHGIKLVMKGLTKQYADLLSSDKYAVNSDRDNFDYIYSVEDLRELRGKKFHAKRNYISRFESTFKHAVREYSEGDFDLLMELYDRWHVKSVHETLDAEKNAIARALNHYKELNLKIALLFADDKLVAYSVNSISDKKIAHTFFEKGDINYIGVYQAINKYTAELFFDGIEHVNRQEDMGIEGLRKVKLSYNPVMLLEKFGVTEKV